jgi:hypothetical protein
MVPINMIKENKTIGEIPILLGWNTYWFYKIRQKSLMPYFNQASADV